jgi:hypothetical protein
VVGIFIIAMMALSALFIGAVRALKEDGSEGLSGQIRQRLGRGICSDWSSSLPRTSFIPLPSS